MDWSDPTSRLMNEHGAKARVGKAKSIYSDWRRTFGSGCYANDVDWLEWRTRDNTPTAVAVIETSFYEDKPELRHYLPQYCSAALARFKRDDQYTVGLMVAREFAVPLYFVLVRCDMANFFVCHVNGDEWWQEMTEPQYRQWIKEL